MLVIRPEREADRARVFEVEAAAFGRRGEAELVEALRSTARPHLSLVAEEGLEIVGHIFFSPVRVESPDGSFPAAGLAPVGVAPGHQGRGTGSALVRAGLDRCAQLCWQAVFLVGDPRYYARFGFSLAAERGFSYGDPRFDPVLQVIELRPGALRGRSGRIVFHPAFAETGTG